MGDIPGLFTDTTSSVRRRQAAQNYGQYTHGHGGNPLKILGAETYLDGNTLAIAHSLTELAQQPAPNMPMGWTGRYENMNTSGTTTPPILRARQADDELNKYSERRKSSAAEVQEKPRDKSAEIEEHQPGRKKRKKRTGEDDGDGSNEAEKKARGRPRLDTNDESAADRRRTQIRMAQRAYRNRKETTISSLEKQVERLQSMTEEMNSAFIGLYDLAMNKGLLQKDPEFGQQFQSATQRFLALASGDETTNHDDASPQTRVPTLAMDHSRDSAGTKRQDSHPDRPSPEDERSSKLTTTSVWGYEISHGTSAPVADTTYTTQRYFEQLPMPSPPKSTDHEIVARATEQNASFHFDMYHYDELPSTSTTQTDYQVNHTTLPDNLAAYDSIQGSSFNPWIQPLPTSTYAHNEISFGRRLHRTIIERGYKLLLNPHLNPAIYKRVFGLTLRLYPKEMLVEALRQVIIANKTEPLSRWNLPFVNLGGSGTYFQQPQQEAEVMPKVNTGRSIGPMTEVISESMEKYLLDNYRGNVPGYEGVWFDTYDVESYLAKRGIHIPPDVEWLTIDLDKINLGDVAISGHMVMSQDESGTTSGGTTATSSSPQSPYLNEIGKQQRVQTVHSVDASLEFFVGGLGNKYTASSSTAPFVSGSSQDLDVSWNGETMMSGTPMDTKFDFGSDQVVSETSSVSQRLVTFSVTRLLEAILRKGICLGRAPGFRPSDVDKALRRTIQEAELSAMDSG